MGSAPGQAGGQASSLAWGQLGEQGSKGGRESRQAGSGNRRSRLLERLAGGMAAGPVAQISYFGVCSFCIEISSLKKPPQQMIGMQAVVGGQDFSVYV